MQRARLAVRLKQPAYGGAAALLSIPPALARVKGELALAKKEN